MQSEKRLMNFREYAQKARILWKEEEYDESRGWTDLAYEEALPLLEEGLEDEGFLETFWSVSMDMAKFLSEDDGDTEHALSSLERAIRTAERLQTAKGGRMLGDALTKKAELLSAEGKTDGAAESAERALAARRRTGDSPELRKALHLLSGLRLLQGRNDEALELAAEEVALSDAAVDDMEAAEGEILLSHALKACGKDRDALVHLRSAAMHMEDDMTASPTAEKAEELSLLLEEAAGMTEYGDERNADLRNAARLMEKVVAAVPWDRERKERLKMLEEAVMEDEENCR